MAAGAFLGLLWPWAGDASAARGAESGQPPARATPTEAQTAIGQLRAPARVFAWAPVAGARSYRVSFYRGTRLVYSHVTTSPRLVLRARWTFGGRKHRMRRGTYRWYVWPVLGPERRLGKAVVQATYRV